MLNNCDSCQYCARIRHHHSDIGCAIQPSYWSMWFRLQHLEQSTLNILPIDECRDYVQREELQLHTLTLTLTLEQWKALVIFNRAPSELIEQVKEQLNLSSPNPNEVIMQPVESSNIEAIGYDNANGSVIVDFLSGSRYRYLDVSVRHYEEFVAAPSKGQYLNQHLKGFYQYERVH